MRPITVQLGVAALAILLTGCAANTQTANRPADQTTPEIPVPVLRVGDPFTADLLGDGQATVTVTATQLCDRTAPGEVISPGNVLLVTTVDIVLDRAGKPLTGGPQNFVFLDSARALHPARTSQAFPPALAVVDLAATGQHVSGKLVFDVPAQSVAGGRIQLVTGRLIHAVWQL